MSPSSKWAALAVAVTSIGALAGPSAASALTIEEPIPNKQLVVKGEPGPDNIALSVNPTTNKIIVVNVGGDTIDAGASAEIVVESGGGADIVDTSALVQTNFKSLIVDGGEGEDQITGSAGSDILNGGAGNDTIVPSKGADTANGGAGNDVFVWNNGDGSDVDNGEEGNDEVMVNGNPAEGPPTIVGDIFSFQADPAGGAPNDSVLFKRTNLGTFEIHLRAEKLTLNGLGGDDTMAPAAGQASGLAGRTRITLNGGAGNDTLTGGDGDDTVNGELGTDFLFGGDGKDTLSGGNETDILTGDKGEDVDNGGAGDDVMAWNNGDGEDIDNGEADLDEAVVNGSPNEGDEFTYKLGDEGRVAFARVNLGQFKINIEAERTTINGLGGDDRMAAADSSDLIPVSRFFLNGGEGNDSLFGTNGDDVLNGEGGSDTLVGMKGDDVDNGGAGDDVMAWNNGDNSDVDNGEGGIDEAVVNGSVAAGDLFSYEPGVAGRLAFKRINLIPFAVNIEAEKTMLNGLGGDDVIIPNAGSGPIAAVTGLKITGGDGNDHLVGDDGNDTVNGDAGDDTVRGGGGNDTLDGGAESDEIDGQDGNDTLTARDGASDIVRGGAGTDSAQADATGIDTVTDVEALDATRIATPPPTPPTAPTSPVDKVAQLPTLGKATVSSTGKKLLAKVPVSCPASEGGGCHVSMSLQTAKAASLGQVKAIVVLGSTSVTLAKGGTTTATVHLIPGASALAKGGKLSVRAQLATSDSAGNNANGSVALTLKVPRR
jgi:Ca2+-binding RTX toxin-like protein